MAFNSNRTPHTNGKTNGTTSSFIPPRLYSVNKPPSLDDFKRLTLESSPIHYPLASVIASNVPIYELPEYSSLSPEQRSALQDEWYHILLSGPGVFVTRGLYKDLELIDRVNEVYDEIIHRESLTTTKKGDHFSPTTSNSRIWNSLSKHCLAHPPSFTTYYSNPYLPLISSSWLGPSHRLTAQVNIVRPGGAPQIAHRDYHIGFQGAAAAAQFPRDMQIASQFLTLQGAVAHSAMPLESGPTRLLPFSQMFSEGYMAYRLPAFQEFFNEHFVSLPLDKGDGLFFNPALFHAAGENTSKDIQRSANLLQVSSAFGNPMESIDTVPLIERSYAALVHMWSEGKVEEAKALIGVVAEGYPFPTNLDNRVPRTEGMAPESEAELVDRGLRGGWGVEQVLEEVRRLREDSRA